MNEPNIYAGMIEGSDNMPNALAVTKEAIEQFQKIQKHMQTAKKENASETYEGLKRDYISLKAILNVAGVNLAELDEIKE